MVEYNFDWLMEKGFFKKSVQLKVKGKDVSVDEKNLLAYVEVSTNEEIEEIKIGLSQYKVRYIWFFFPATGKLKVFRRIGEVKWFYYFSRMRSDYIKSRVDKLNKFSPDSMNILFDIRDVVEKFYWQLWEHRILMARSIKKLKEDKNKLLVVQHLIDRLIFFYFLAQLKLVKIKNEEKEWVLDRKNTREFFKWICDQLSESDLQKFLNKIFFNVLGQVNESGFISEEFAIGKERFSIASPCLNGGLFIEEKIEEVPEREIEVSGIKKLILEVLNNYNWIIGEELPEEEDVIGDLTPEIIGHIYEKFVVSLEQIGIGKIRLKDVQTVKEELRYGRKKIGAYYTPGEITDYISMNTIYPYIRDRLKRVSSKSGEALLDDIFKKKSFNKQELEIIRFLYFEVLTKMKICDNACGSGSFLIAAGDVLLRLYSRVLKILEENLIKDKDVKEVLKEIRNSPTRNYYIVRQIIMNNLYGVDIMEGAVEIAKLRFWLWLISQVDPKRIVGKRIETLPNLDFNLMVGNSLIGFVDIEDIEFDFISVRPKKRWKTLPDKQYLITTWTDENKVKWLKELAKQKQEFKTLPSHEAVKLKEKLNKELNEARVFLNEKFYNMLKSKGIKISKEEFLKLKPFHWGFEFYEVFDLEKIKEERGFDAIIGNPPYINIYNLSEKEKEIYSQIYALAYKKYDIYILFIERSLNLVSNYGEFSYITSDKWIAEEYGYKLRELILNKKILREIIDFRYHQVFAGVGIRNIIFFLSKSRNYDKFLVKNYNFKIKKLLSYHLIKAHPNYHLRLDLTPINSLMILETLKDSIKINDICYVNWGCRPSPSEKYVFGSFEQCLKRTKNKKLCKRLVKGLNIGRYFFRWKGKWLAYLNDMYNPLFPEFFENDRIIIKDIGVKPLKATLIKGKEKLYSDHTTINLIKWENVPVNKINNSMVNFKTHKDIDLKFLLSLINSKLINYFIIVFLSDQLHVLPGNTRNIPIKFPLSQIPFTILTDYMLFLNSIEERRTKEKETIDFIDKQIIDSLVYELYFKEKFEQDRIKINLLELVELYLKDISNLNSDEQKLHVIKEVAEKIKNDKKITEQIEKIKSHPWVKIIEGDGKMED